MKFSAFLSCVEVNKCVTFQIPRYKSFNVGIFRISPIDHKLESVCGLIDRFWSMIYDVDRNDVKKYVRLYTALCDTKNTM